MQNDGVAGNERANRQPAKILFVTPFSWLYGEALCLLEVVTGLNRQRFAPTVVTSGEGPLVGKLRAVQVPVKSLRMPYMTHRGRQAFDFVRSVLPVSLRLARYVRQGQFDIVYNNTLLNPYGALAARLTGVPCLWHVHEMGKDTLRRIVATHVAGLLATRLVVVSRAAGALFSRGAQQKIRLVYNGVALRHFDPNSFDPAAARRTLSIQPSQPVVGIVGRLHPSKRHHDLLLAMSELQQRWPDCLLLIVGDGPLELDLRLTTRRLGLEKNVRFLGYMADVGEALAALDVLVLPSEHEAFPRVILEAMAMAKPVVATAVGGVPEAVSPDTGRLVSHSSPSELASAISFILEDRERAVEMGRRGRERVLAQFSLEHYVQGLEDVMTEMLCASGSSIKSPSTQPQPIQLPERTPHI